MGGCRCSYRTCTVKSDGTTHMFHYPVFDKLRCHQWLTNAQKLEFLNLKVSQLKNRVVCQHHFRDDNFMNFKKDKLTFDAVPTLDGPFCEPSSANQQEIVTPYPISLDDIENENNVLTLEEKQANFSLKYGDFLTNNEVMDLLNQTSDNTLLPSRNSNAVEINNVIDYEPNLKSKLVPTKSIKSNRNQIQKSFYLPASNNVFIASPIPLEHENIHGNLDNANKISTPLLAERKTNYVSNITDMTEMTRPSYRLRAAIDSQPSELMKRINTVNIKNENTSALNIQKTCPTEISNISERNTFIENNNVNQNNLTTNKIIENANTPAIGKEKRVRIISEKKISKPVSVVGKLEPVSPSTLLLFSKRAKNKMMNMNKPTKENDDISNENKVTHVNILNTDENNHIILNNNHVETIPNEINQVLEKSKDVNENIPFPKTSNTPNNITPSNNNSLLKNKVNPVKMAAIKEKRKFNMKLRDIIESCLDNLDVPDKTNYENQVKEILQKKHDSEKGVCSYLSKYSDSSNSQQYTIAYLEARMKKMENNLLSKIDQNSQRILDLKASVAPQCETKTISTQCFSDEEAYKKHLYKEISKYLSSNANSLVYEELFLNKYSKGECGSVRASKRRKCR